MIVTICTLHQTLLLRINQEKENRGKESENLKERDRLGDIGVDVRIILKWALNRQSFRVSLVLFL